MTSSAIQLIRRVEDSSYELTGEGRAFLQSVDEPLAVVTVAGVYRSGKSTLLSMLDRSSAFEVGSTTNACTFGLYVSPTIIRHHGKAILLVDSEGLDSAGAHADAKHDSTIFVLALLLGSQFIYNATGAINDSSLSTMSLVCNLSKRLSENSANVQDHMPRLRWLARDFSLKLEDESGAPITPDQYLERAIAPTGNTSKDVVRKTLRDCFPQRSANTIVRPVTDESELQGNLLESSLLRPEFVEQMDALRDAVFDTTPVKKVCGAEMTGPLLVTMVDAWLGGINKGGIPKLDDSWTMLVKSKNLDAMQVATRLFDSGVDGVARSLPVAHDHLTPRLFSLKAECLDAYKEARFVAEADSFLRDMDEYTDSVIERTVKQNKKLVNSAVETLLVRMIAPLEGKIAARAYHSAAEFKKDYADALAAFTEELKEAIGSKAAKSHVSAFFITTNDMVLASIDTVVSHTQVKVDSLTAALADSPAAGAAARQECADLTRKTAALASTAADASAAVRAAQEATASCEEEKDALLAAHEEARASHRDEVEKRRIESAAAMDEWKGRMLSRMEASNAEKNDVQELLADTENRLVAADERGRKLAEESESSAARLRQMDRVVQDSVSATQSAARLQKELTKATTIGEELEDAIKTLKIRQSREVGVMQQQVAKKLAQSRKTIAAKEGELVRQHDAHQAYKVEMGEVRDAYDAALQQTAKVSNDLEAQHAATQKHVAALLKLQSTKDAADATIDALHDSVGAAQEQLGKTKADLTLQLSAANADAGQAKARLKTHASDMSQRFKEIGEALSGKKRRVSDLEGVLDSQRSVVFQHDHLVKRTAVLEESNVVLEKENRQMRRELDDIRSEHTLEMTKLRLKIEMQ
jgi:hypothetical protein